MNMSQLYYVKAVVETGSFSRAAERCFVTQPSLSTAIAQLEEELGNRLFIRTTRRVALSPLGQHLLPSIEDLLTAQARLVEQAKTYRQISQTLIRIGVSPVIDIRLVMPIIEGWHSQHPEAEVILREANMASLHHLLAEQELDLIFVPVVARKNNLEHWLFYEEPMRFLPCGLTTPAPTQPAEVLLEEIAAETFVLVPDECGLTRATRELFKSQHFQLNESADQAHSYRVLEEWAALGRGAAILPESKISSENQASRPLYLKTGAAVKLTYEAMWSKASPTQPVLQAFVEYLKTVSHPVVKTAPRLLS